MARSTRSRTTDTCGRPARFCFASSAAWRSPSMAATEPLGPTASARKAENSPTPAYRSSARSPADGRSIPSTVSTSTRGAPGCTCQKPSPATVKLCAPSEVSTCSTTGPDGSGSRASGWAIRHVSTSTTSWERCLRRPLSPPGRWTYCIRVRQASPSWSPGTGSTSTSRSSPANRVSCSSTTLALSLRCSASSTCWKSQPPHPPGCASGQGAWTRWGDGTETCTASPRRNRPLSSVTSTVTCSPGNACRTKMTIWRSSRPVATRATKCPPWATGPTSTSKRSPTSESSDAVTVPTGCGHVVRRQGEAARGPSRRDAWLFPNPGAGRAPR